MTVPSATIYYTIPVRFDDDPARARLSGSGHSKILAICLPTLRLVSRHSRHIPAPPSLLVQPTTDEASSSIGRTICRTRNSEEGPPIVSRTDRPPRAHRALRIHGPRATSSNSQWKPMGARPAARSWASHYEMYRARTRWTLGYASNEAHLRALRQRTPPAITYTYSELLTQYGARQARLSTIQGQCLTMAGNGLAYAPARKH